MALETAVQPGSIALLENAQIVTQTDLAAGERTTRSLMPAIQAQLAQSGWQPSDLELIAVSHGPGSFTGLRVGVTVAKTLAYAIGAQVIGIDTLDVIARQAPLPPEPSPDHARLWTVMDAQRQQLFSATYELTAERVWSLTEAPRVTDVDVWLEQLQAGDLVSGPPISKLGERLPAQVIAAGTSTLAPRATSVGELAFAAFEAGRRDDLWGLVPKYHRLSAAEEKLAGNR